MSRLALSSFRDLCTACNRRLCDCVYVVEASGKLDRHLNQREKMKDFQEAGDKTMKVRDGGSRESQHDCVYMG